MASQLSAILSVLLFVWCVEGASKYCRCSRSQSTCSAFSFNAKLECEPSSKPCEVCNCDETGNMFCEVAETVTMDTKCNPSASYVTRCPKLQGDEAFCNKNKVIVSIEGTPVACINTIKVTDDLRTAYNYSNWETQVKDGLKKQFITIRFVKSMATNTMGLCAVYGKGTDGEREGNMGASTAIVHINNSYPVKWLIMDDPAPYDNFYPDNMEEAATYLNSSHAWKATKSDGFCVGPITDKGQDFELRWENLANIIGVNVNSWDDEEGRIIEGGEWLLKSAPGKNPKDYSDKDGHSLIPVEIKSLRFISDCYCPV